MPIKAGKAGLAAEMQMPAEQKALLLHLLL